MNKKVILVAVLFVLAGCGKKVAEATEPEAGGASDQKFDLKGMYPGMSTANIEAVLGKLPCIASAELIQGMERNINEAKTNLKQISESGQPATEESNLLKQKLEKIIDFEKTGRLQIIRNLYTEVMDTVCVVQQESGKTYANLPTTVEVGLKKGKVMSIALDVIGANSESLLDAMMLKYHWADGANNGAEQYAIRFQQGISLMQGITDARNNTLTMAQSPDVTNAVRIALVSAKIQKAIADITNRVNIEINHVPDT